MARALLVGCGCCAQGAGELLRSRGWAVRGTSRDATRRERIAGRGLEAVAADPDRVGSIVGLLGDVTVLAWLLGSASGDAEQVAALHRERLPSLLAKLVDTPVRGFVYEQGEAPAAREAGAESVADAEARWRIPVRLLTTSRAEPERWAEAVADAVEAVISAPVARAPADRRRR